MVAPHKSVAALGALATLSCSGLLGIDDEQADVAHALCVCPDAIQSFGGESCEDYVTARLESATPSTRSAWMKSFDEHCKSGCSGCWDAVFYQRPTCTDPADDCVNADCADCCNSTASGAQQCG